MYAENASLFCEIIKNLPIMAAHLAPNDLQSKVITTTQLFFEWELFSKPPGKLWTPASNMVLAAMSLCIPLHWLSWGDWSHWPPPSSSPSIVSIYVIVRYSFSSTPSTPSQTASFPFCEPPRRCDAVEPIRLLAPCCGSLVLRCCFGPTGTARWSWSLGGYGRGGRRW